ncbi:MAG: alpha/beta hydrolase [Pirellulaceae bacterium]
MASTIQYRRSALWGRTAGVGCMLAVLWAAAVCGQEAKRAKNAKRERAQADNARRYPPDMPGAKIEVYKEVGDVKLNMYVFQPAGHQPTDRRPAIVFFFGGGWSSGTPAQFQHQCEHLAQRGMVAMAADYRVATRHQVKAIDCVRDAKSAIRWVRRESERLGVDPQRIAAGGGSAGGHLAACTGVIDGLDEPDEDLAISSRPSALVLFNPALVLAEIEGAKPVDADRIAQLSQRMGTEPRALSPYHHVRSGAPPAIIFHGKADSTVPFATAEAFTAAMTKAGSRCELVGYDGQQHGFFNYGRSGNEYYQQTLTAMDEFLTSLDYLSPTRR